MGYKNNFFISCPNSTLFMGYKKITNFYILQSKSSLDKIFYKVISSYYLHVTLDDIFCRGSHGFS
jgi:hypothetical protein